MSSDDKEIERIEANHELPLQILEVRYCNLAAGKESFSYTLFLS
jgi:hypothetical protein